MNNFLHHGIKPRVSCKKDNNKSEESTSDLVLNSPAGDTSKIMSTRQTTVDPSNDFKNNRFNQHHQLETAKTLEYLANSSKMKSKRLLRRIHRIAEVRKYSYEEAYNFIIKKSKRRRERFSQKSLEDYLYPQKTPDKARHTLELRIHHVISEECQASRDDELEVLQKYQLSIHKEDDWTMKRYKKFLITSPIIKKKILKNLPNAAHNQDDTRPQLPLEYGSHHCQYWLDNKLIAVGVLDILTTCISSVYLYYDPEYSFLNLGVYSALHEISMVRSLHTINSNITNYYMGFYIHTCPKMSYKIKYQPSSLLCPETNNFVESYKCLEKLHHSRYARFSSDDAESGFIRPNLSHLPRLVILDEGSLVTIGKFLEILSKSNITINRLIEAVLDYSQLVGCHLSNRMILGSSTLKEQYLSD